MNTPATCSGSQAPAVVSETLVHRSLAVGLEVAVAALLVVPTLLYSSYFRDNILAKGGVVLVLGAVTAAIWAALQASERGLLVLRSPVYLPFLLYLGAGVASLAFAQNPRRSGEIVLYYGLFLLVFMAVSQRFREPSHARRLVGLILGLGLIVSGIGLLQYNGIRIIDIPRRYADVGYPIATLGNTNFVAYYLDLLIPLAVAMAAAWRRSWKGHVALLIAVLAIGQLVLCKSWGGWLSTAAGLGVLGVAMAPPVLRLSRMILLPVVAAPIGLAAIFTLGSMRLGAGDSEGDSLLQIASQTGERMAATLEKTGYSRSMRVLIWKDTASLIRANPWLGVGPGNYGISLPAYRTAEGQRNWKELMGQRANEPFHAHSEYLETWSEFGIVGVVSLLWLLGAVLWVGWRGLARSTSVGDDPATRERRAIIAGCLGGLAAAVVHAASSFNLQDPVSGTHFWVLAGLMAASGGEGVPGRLIRLPQERQRSLVLAAGVGAVLVGAYTGVCILAGDAYYSRGWRHLEDGHGNRAILAFRQAIQWRGHDPLYHHTLGMIAGTMGQQAEAETSLRRSLQLQPHSPQAMRLLARTLMVRERPAEAAQVLERALDIDRLTVANYVLLAKAQGAAGDYAAAVASCQQALVFRPDDVALMMDLGLAFREGGDPEQAHAVLTRAAARQPSNGVIQGNLGVVCLQLRRLEEAESQFREAMRRDPDHRHVWRANLARALMLQGRVEEARREAAGAAAEAPEGEPTQRRRPAAAPARNGR